MYDELIGNLRAQATHFHFNDDTSLLLCKAADAIEELSNIQIAPEKIIQTMWIPMTERLPEPNAVDEYGFAKGYLVKTDRHVMIHTARYTGEWWILWGYHKVITDNVTHWMPLPEPPESEGK